MRKLWLCLTLWIGVAPGWALHYVKRDTWRETWDASVRASRATGVEYGPWHYIGPFDHTGGKGFAAVYPPEQEIKLDATYSGKNGREVSWQEGIQFRDRAINSLRIFEDNDWIAVYIHRVITAAEEVGLQVSLGSDDGIKVWVNGREVLAHEVSRACLPDQELVTLPLRKGANDLLIKVTQGEGPSGFYFAAQGITPALGPWQYIGPFDHTDGKGFDTAYPPEREYDPDGTYEGKGGRQLRWQDGRQFRDGQVNSLSIFEDNENIAVYLRRTITAPTAMSLPVSLGSDDGLKVWVNGELVLANNTTRGCAPDQDFATLPLRQGENALLMKVVQGGGPSGFYFALAGSQVLEEELLQRVLADFPDDALQIMVERDWYQQDEIAELEGPYAEAVERAVERARALLNDLAGGEARAAVAEQAARLDGLLRRLQALRERAPDGRGDEWRALYLELHWLKREIALSNPLLDFDKVLFVKHVPGRYSHMCDQNYGWHARPGGGLFVLEQVGRSLAVRDVVGNQLPEGSFMHPALSYDGRRVLFAYWRAQAQRPADNFYHIYEIGVDGSGLRQLTDGEWDDFNPCYLPDGDIVFVSTRRGGYGRCHGRPVPLYTLHRMHGDGSGIRRLSHNEANEWDPSVLDDGRIAYSRWDYVDRHAVDYQSLWTCWPDGTNPVAQYGNATKNPMATYQPRQIPGGHEVVCLSAAHHACSVGTLVRVDPWRDFDGLAPLTRLTPEVPFIESEGWPAKYSYTTPWPLSQNHYLAAFSFRPIETEGRLNRPNDHGLYLVDTFGSRELLYRDLEISSVSPIPLRPREAPPALPWRSDPGGEAEGRFLLVDVYRSRHGLERGSIKTLRVVQILPKATPIADSPRLGMAGQETGKYVLGTVPVAEDGSAFFRAPADRPVYFQALDADGMAVQSMRTITYLEPGQTLSCVGCHEQRNTAPPLQRPQAVRRGPVEITPGPDGSAPLSYPLLVQPVLDRHCIRCHAGDEPAGGLRLTGESIGQFSASYEALMSRPGLVHRWFAYDGEPVTKPYSCGAHASRLTQILRQGHHGVELSDEDWERLVTWMDTNANFYGTFFPEEQERQRAGERVAKTRLE